MSWYKKASIRDEKSKQAKALMELLEKCSKGALIDGGLNEPIVDELILKLSGGKKGFRVIIRKSVANDLIEILQSAKSVKKDSPSEFIALINEAMSVLCCEV
jgi:hypothetical protein